VYSCNLKGLRCPATDIRHHGRGQPSDADVLARSDSWCHERRSNSEHPAVTHKQFYLYDSPRYRHGHLRIRWMLRHHASQSIPALSRE